jgi:type I restriction-modification system DNA methylase subunit
MPLSWNEIKTRAASFVLDWKDSQTVREKAEAQTFETAFLNVFGVERKKSALFEHEVRLGEKERGYIDLFWKGHIIIEMKTPGKDLDKAFEQAKAYALSLPQKDIPKGILTCDFLNFQYYDLEDDAKCYHFTLEELPANVELFGELAGYKDAGFFKQWDPVNIEAAEKMGKLYTRLKETGYSGHQLKLYLVRLMFCLFADDTGIFEPPNLLNKYIFERTSEDGSDLALHLQKIFEVLNKPKESRSTMIDEQLNQFPYVNGKLFEERIETADFDRAMRDTIFESCTVDWSKISPAIFGAMFQSVMNDIERHDIGAHYTSEENILKLIRPLFLDNLREEFNKIKNLSPKLRDERLKKFHDKIASLKFLDPACGCGNFLVISYRELRLLELEVLEILLGKEQVLDIDHEIKVNVNQFYGIEIEEFPAQIAQVALWLVDHQMNMMIRERFGTYFIRIPLVASASIHCANALALDWESVIPKSELSYILGNPPFLGYSNQSESQKADIVSIYLDEQGKPYKTAGKIDYVSAWYYKAAKYLQGTEIRAAFVSTNSITQGEQVAAVWKPLFDQFGIHIDFGYRTFKWTNEARGNAAVHCVIVGFSEKGNDEKAIYDGEHKIAAKNINPYLVDAPNIFIDSRSKPLCNIPEMITGNRPADGGHLIIADKDLADFIKNDPLSENYIRQFMGSEEFINNKKRWCLWLVGVPPSELRKMPEVIKRIAACKQDRENAPDVGRRKLAETPTLFREQNASCDDYIVVPKVSSERRHYLPIGYVSATTIASDLLFIIPKSTLYHFGILTSNVHMAWMRTVCGRLKSDYRYSKDIVYNNFPWPNATEEQKAAIEKLAQTVLDARAKYPDSSLADLYDPLTMPPDLLKAHRALDTAVMKLYGFAKDMTEAQIVAELMERYRGLVE